MFGYFGNRTQHPTGQRCAVRCVPERFDITYQAPIPDSWAINYDCENTGLANLRTIDIRICDTYGDALSPIEPTRRFGFQSVQASLI